MSDRERDTSRDSLSARPPRTLAERAVALGTALGCGVLAALVGSGPAALRIRDVDGESRGWLLLAASAVPFTTLAVLVCREAYAGLRSYMGEGRNFVRVFVTSWLGATAAFLFVLGGALRANTHHHALAGVTFALTGAAALVGIGWIAHRVARLVESLRTHGYDRAHALASTAIFALVAVMVLVGARRLHTKLPTESAAAMIDTTALLLASLLAARPELRASRTLAVLGPIAAVMLVALGMTSLSPELRALVTQRAPAFDALLDVFGRGS